MGIAVVAVIIGMFIFGGLFLAAITADTNAAYVADTGLENTVPMVSGMMEIFVGLAPLLIGFGILALVVIAALYLFRSSKRRY